jgi:CRISPR system Cascade subunit CasE
MTYLSMLTLNPKNRTVQRDLSDIYLLHQTVLRAFTGISPGRVMFRLEQKNEISSILVQSPIEPQWSILDSDYFAKNPVHKEFKPAFDQGQQFRFRLRANPTVKRQGKREGLLREEDQINWLIRKSSDCGFHVLSAYVHDQRMESGKDGDGREISLFCVTFEGIMSVTGPSKLLVALENGIGSGKGFGNGLLSLARIR